MFPNLFNVPMDKRTANKRAFQDYDDNVGRLVRPETVSGTHLGKLAKMYCNKSVIARIIPTHDDDICLWDQLRITPIWRIKVIQDPLDLCKLIMNPYILGPSYEIGRKGSLGPFNVIFDEPRAQ